MLCVNDRLDFLRGEFLKIINTSPLYYTCKIILINSFQSDRLTFNGKHYYKEIISKMGFF